MKGSAVRRERRWGIGYWTLPEFAALGVRTAFFLRTGGVSRGDFRGLNLGLNTGDETERVLHNRRVALKAAGFRTHAPVAAVQVHGTRLREVGLREAGRGWLSLQTALPGIDGLMTGEKGLPLAIGTADCVPVLFAAAGVGVAAVHAGWRGMAGTLLAKTVRRFKTAWRVPPSSLHVALGPGIGPEAFTVTGEVLETLRQACPGCICRRTDGSTGADLWDAGFRQLTASGVSPEHIYCIRDCTAAHPRKYFSYRRDHGITGRMLSVIQRDR